MKYSNELILQTIKEHRLDKGYTNEVMAYELDISPSTYNKIERNEIKLTVERLIQIMDILEIKGNKIFKSDETKLLNQQIYDNAIGYQVEKYYHDNKELFEKLLSAKDDLIENLKSEIKRLEVESK